jgi:hypothetical protein
VAQEGRLCCQKHISFHQPVGGLGKDGQTNRGANCGGTGATCHVRRQSRYDGTFRGAGDRIVSK